MAEGKIRPLLDMVAQLEPPVLGKRLDTLEEALRLLNERTSQMRLEITELHALFLELQVGEVDQEDSVIQLRQELTALQDRVRMVSGLGNKI